MNTFFIADTHFGDHRILKYENRPFDTVEKMDTAIVSNWNSTVGPDDIVYHLGDVGEASYISKLNGIKYLIKGNHDIEDNDYYRKAGFKEVYDKPIILNNFWMLSHEPLYVNSNMPYANLFGHVHNNPIYQTSSIQSYCVTVERIEYRPISFDKIKHTVSENVKMVVTDLDGTLLKSDKTISEYTASIIKKLRSKGVLFTVATARPIRAVRDYLPFLDYDCAVYHNGAVVTDGLEVLDGFGINNPLAVISAVLKDRPESHIAIEANDVMYSNFEADKLWPGVEYIHTNDFSELAGANADKIIIECHSLKEMDELNKYISNDLYLQLSENVIAMVMNKKATKIDGIKKLARNHNLALDQIVSFGDDYNDKDMLKQCGIGIAVDNALPEIKKISDHICDNNDADGVAKWLDENIF